MITEADIELLYKAYRSMCQGELKSYPRLMEILKERNLLYYGDLELPVTKFIPEIRQILQENQEKFAILYEELGIFHNYEE